MAQLPSESLFGDYSEWPGRDVLDSGGERLGGVREIYLDRETGHPEWVLVDVEDDTARFVPLADAEVGSATIRVAHSASQIRSAPGIGAEAQIDQAEERRLYAHYGLGYSEDDSGSGLPSEDAPVPQVDSRHETIESAAPPATSSGTPEARTETFRSATPSESSAPPSGWGAPTGDAAPVTGWGAPSTGEPNAWGTPEEPAADESTTPSSWSEAAIDAPPPAEPPSPEEIASADIPEPPAASAPDDAPAPPAPDEPSTIEAPALSLGPDTGTPELEAADEPPALEAPEEPLALDPPVGTSEPAVAPLTPTVSPPELATAGTGSSGPAPTGSVPPRPAQTSEPAWSSTPTQDEPAGALATLKARRSSIAAAAAVAAVLLLIVRRLR